MLDGQGFGTVVLFEDEAVEFVQYLHVLHTVVLHLLGPRRPCVLLLPVLPFVLAEAVAPRLKTVLAAELGRERDAAFAPGLFAEALEVQVLEVGPDEAACREGIEELFGEADIRIELGQRRAVEAQAVVGNKERGRSQQLQPLLDVARSEGIGPAAGILLGTDAVDLAA